MTTQTEMFPRTTLELLEELAEVHRADRDKAVKALEALSDDEKIAKAYQKASDRVGAAHNLVVAIDQAAERERKRLITRGPDVARNVMQEAADIVNSGALDPDGVGVDPTVPPAVDPITGEVMSKAAAVSCDTCGNDDCNLRQCEGSNHTGCGGGSWEPRKPEVIALYPGDDDPHETPVGDRTRYGELVADYFTVAGLNVGHSVDDWTVVARRELTQDGGGYRNLRDVIAPEDYGQELLVVALEQGSVVGAPAEKVAS